MGAGSSVTLKEGSSLPSTRSLIQGYSSAPGNPQKVLVQKQRQKNGGNEKSPSFFVNVTEISKGLLNISNSSYEVILRISYESLDVLDKLTEKPYFQFPYQIILCWGCSSSVFQFKVFPVALDPDTKEKDAVCIIVQTSQGKQIENLIMIAVRRLMSDMECTAVSAADFSVLKECMFDSNKTLIVSITNLCGNLRVTCIN